MTEQGVIPSLYGSHANASVIGVLERQSKFEEGAKLALAEAYFRAARFRESLSLAQTLARSSFFGFQGRILSTRALLKIGEVEAAVKILSDLAAELGAAAVPSDLAILLAQRLLANGAHGAALEFLERAGGENDPGVTSLHAMLLVRFRRWDEAAMLVARRLARVPSPTDQARMRLLCARLYILSKNFEVATFHFARVLDLLPPDGRLYHRAARAAFRANRTGAAERWIALAVAFGFDSSSCRKLMGRIRLASGNYVGAIQAFLVSLKMNDDAETVLLLAIARIKAKKYAGALEQITDFLDRYPDHFDARLWYARLLHKMEAPEEAERVAVQLVREHSDSADVHGILGEIRASQGAFAEAAESFRTALTIRPDDPLLADWLAKCETAQVERRDYSEIHDPESEVQAVLERRIPDAFLPQWTASDLYPRMQLFRALGIQGRVLFALMMRDMRSRFPVNRLGYLLAFVDPTLFILLHVAFWSLIGTSPLPGMTVAMFLISGFAPFFLFQYVFTRTMTAPKSAGVLMVHRRITLLDLYLTKGIMEFLTMLFVFILLLIMFKILGDTFQIYRPLDIGVGLILLGVMGIGLAMFLDSLYPVIGDTGKVFVTIVVRAQYYISGIFLAPQAIPSDYLKYLMWNPVLHIIEIIREGLSPTVHLAPVLSSGISSISLPYAAACSFGCLLLGLLANRAFKTTLLDR
jgi:capsular polysaccharide transport system permease protein